MKYIIKANILFIFCAILAACSDDQPLTKEQQCIQLQREMVVNQQYNHNYASGVREMRQNSYAQRYHELGCKK